jgi:hypothetical protein
MVTFTNIIHVSSMRARPLVSDPDYGERRFEADVLLPFFGLSQNLGPIAPWGPTSSAFMWPQVRPACSPLATS